MKELTIEQKARAYDEALARARKLQENSNGMILKKWLWNIFPELKESEDEKIKKALISILKSDFEEDTKIFGISGVGEIIAWLEKQGKLPIPKLRDINEVVEPKFHEGDWVIYNNDICQIVKREEGCNILVTQFGVEKEPVNERNLSTAKLWDISDARDGDVLVSRSPFIYGKQCPYGGLNWCNNKFIKASNFIFTDSPVHPATKEQRDLLFQKMKEAEYIFDFKNKELKKIKNDIEIPFGAKDSELQEATYFIPKGFYAEIDNDRVVIKKGNKEDESWFKEIELMCLNFSNDTDYREEFFTWLKSIKDRVGCEVNCTTAKEWSEEDKHRVKDTIYFLDTAKKHYASTVELDACIDWLKSLEDRVQPKQEWSAEDNSVLKDIKVAVASYWDEDTENIILDWLKSLKQRIGG